jgi:hypothetical protein
MYLLSSQCQVTSRSKATSKDALREEEYDIPEIIFDKKYSIIVF